MKPKLTADPSWGAATGGRPAANRQPRQSADYLLDLVPGAAAAFGLRCLRTALARDAAGMIARLRRDADGSSEDVGALADGHLDVGAVARLLGGRKPSFAAWYDQSGHANHAYPIRAWPEFEISPDSGRAMLRFRPPAQLRSPVTLEGLNAFSIFAAFRAATAEAARSVARWQNEGDFVVFPYHTGNVLIGWHNAPFDALPVGVAPGEFAVYGIVWQRGAEDGFATYRNGAPVAQQTARDAPIAVRHEPLFIGSYAGLGEHFEGDLVELIIWPRALSEGEVQLVSADMAGAIPLAGEGPREAETRPPIPAPAVVEAANRSLDPLDPGADLLEIVPDAAAAFSLRRLRRRLDRPIIRLERPGDGKIEDFECGEDGALDAAALGRFLDRGSAYCAAWYDQSERGNDAEPLFLKPAPDIANMPGPALRFRPPAQLRSALTLRRVSGLSIFAVFRAPGLAASRSVARWQKEGDFVVFPYHTGDVLLGVQNSPIDRLTLGVTPGEFAVYGLVWRQGAEGGFATYRNGELVARRPARNLPIDSRGEPLFLGSYAGAGEHFEGDLAELVIWERALSEKGIGFVSENMRAGCAALWG